jgi:hypothetical protein
MATEVGGISVGIVIGNGVAPPPPEQLDAINSFLHGFYNQSATLGTATQAGEQVVVTDLGRTLHFFGGASGAKMIFDGSADGAVGTGHGGFIKGRAGDNDIIITDDTSYGAKLGDGDDFLQNTGSGPIDARGQAGNDAIVGGAGNDVIKGNLGKDFLQGGDGDDTIGGGAGKDTIIGGGGDDTMTGGPGRDLFVIGNEPTGRDIITDFEQRDTLEIRDRTGDGQVTVGANGDVQSITHDAVNDTITVVLRNGDMVVLQNIGDDRLNLSESSDGIFVLH